MDFSTRKIPDKVRKPVEVVTARATGSEFTLLDKKIFNILLAHSYYAMSTRAIHRIAFRDLSDYLQMGSHESLDRINQSLDRLFHGEIDIRFRDDEGEEGILKCHYLSFQRSTRADGYLNYAFDPILIEFLKNPKFYSLIQLPVVAKFRTSYALRLYEMMQMKYGLRLPVWKVGIDDAKAHFEIAAESANQRLDLFKSRVVEKAVDEVNEFAEFNVGVEFHRNGRGGKVTELTFSAWPKSGAKIAAFTETGGAPRRAGRRDRETVDMFNGRNDGTPPTLRAETMNEARRIVAGEGDVVALFQNWLDAFSSRGFGADPDETFLAWLRLHLQKAKDTELEGVDVDAIFNALLEEG